LIGDGAQEVFAGSVAAVIVSYYPDVDHLRQQLQALSHQVGNTIIVNNGPTLNLPIGDSAIPFILIESGSNIGIATAINRGIDAAGQAGARYVLLLDQDSLPSDGMVSRLFAAYMRLRAQGRSVAAIGPVIIDQKTGRITPFACDVPTHFAENELVCPVDRLLSSGSFIDLEIYGRIGPMDEELFIDLVDTEWCLRAASMGYQSYGLPAARLYHQLGSGAVKYWCGRWRYLPSHSPFRSYYMIRNRILLLSRPYIPVVRRLQELLTLLYLLVAGVMLLPRRWERLKMIAHGITDGVRGCGGKACFLRHSLPKLDHTELL